MKKLLAMLLVCGLATMASAAMYLSVNGEPAPQEITIYPSDVIELDIEIEADQLLGYDVEIRAAGPALIDSAQITFDGGAGVWFGAPAVAASGPDFVRITAGGFPGFAPGLTGPAVVAENIFLHCEGEGDVIVTLFSFDSTINEQALQGVVQELIIHQMPEPMTMALLGLGGLFLRRRK